MEIKIPKRFYDDHCERDLEAPPVIRSTKTHYYIDGTSEQLDELLSDAEYYAGEFGPDAEWLIGIKSSARATARSIKAANAG